MAGKPVRKPGPYYMGRLRGGHPRGVHIDLDGNTATELHADTKAWFRWLAAMAMTGARVQTADVEKILARTSLKEQPQVSLRLRAAA